MTTFANYQGSGEAAALHAAVSRAARHARRGGRASAIRLRRQQASLTTGTSPVAPMPFAGRRRQLRATCSTCGGPLLDDALIGTYSHGWLVLMAMDAARRKWHLSVLLTPDAARSV